jgi:hypothetical protein
MREIFSKDYEKYFFLTLHLHEKFKIKNIIRNSRKVYRKTSRKWKKTLKT